ncbi:hypothetical protein JWG39_04780 [Desulforhopalus vacuolatus]|uniref:hypothetical protein n=1 Tax=Desulforhopalus vacuolatus TaxID=40414 RepID=UPI00196594D4|nr:hypothetical protein [Desulforhopalus vacuolatus]MBM9519132.1 hypothetical protein [Desulforhopalus vacuolatus]
MYALTAIVTGMAGVPEYETMIISSTPKSIHRVKIRQKTLCCSFVGDLSIIAIFMFEEYQI